ncbi:glycosyl hydrolase [Protomyces lactucae-debilis]|uniref:Glycosyl hydrolase n=1 Tax=Protomyces lactucae-debilis TaxID=2754530 RepID=A0A1Y2FVI4_PROLT|nr:glycosyl hydrolase [Protomyces lactucae-debilis]ORY88002.1 glycosyl hydrolase [Protomyces lactucae-debilis]
MFQRHRPASHVIARRSFMNDPCSFVYIPETGEYLLCYQWSVSTQDSYGECYGTCTSTDLVVWHDKPSAIQRGHASYDSQACFSGSILPRTEHGHTVLYLYYTSVSSMPISWKLPYVPGCETQSLAISRDFGKSWQRHAANPLLKQPPAAHNTTGWRDPFVSEWPAMAKMRGKAAVTAYMLLSSGTRDGGPCVRLYESSDLVNWADLGVLFSAQRNAPLTPPVPGLHYGENFECVSFATIGNSLYLFCGVEADSSQSTRHDGHFVFWHRGTIHSPECPTFVPIASGTLDHDILYAVHTTKTEHDLIQLGWADEDDNKHKLEQDWSGVLGLPRRLCELSVPKQRMIDSHAWTSHGDRMTTLGIDVYAASHLLRSTSKHYNGYQLHEIASARFELDLVLSVAELVFCFRMNDQECTRIIVDKAAITLDRSRSSKDNGNTLMRSGPFQLLQGESLHLRVFCDGSLVEVFANGRFCMTSRIYPSSSNALSMSLETPPGVDLSNVSVYADLKPAWPGRIASASL